MTDMNETIQAATNAVTGPGSPESVRAVMQDDPKVIWVRVLSGPALCAMIAVCIVLLAWGQKLHIWTEVTERARADYIGILAIILTCLLGLVFWIITPGRPSRLEVKAGPASVTLEGGRE